MTQVRNAEGRGHLDHGWLNTGHRDMEIISYVIGGPLAHEGRLGAGSACGQAGPTHDSGHWQPAQIYSGHRHQPAERIKG